jgi:hypothetical protein
LEDIMPDDINPDPEEDPEEDPKPGNGPGEGDNEDMVTMTQTALDAKFADRADRASRSAVSKLLKDVGFEDVNGLKEALTDWQGYKDSQKTEREKLQGDLDAAQTRVSDLEAQLAIANSQIKELVIRGAVSVAAREQNFLPEASQDIWLLIQNEADLFKLLKFDEETLKVTGSDKVVKEVAKMRPHWVGTPERTKLTPGGRKTTPKSQNSRQTPPEEGKNLPLVHF